MKNFCVRDGLCFSTPLRLRENRGGGRVALRPRVLRLSGDGPTLSLDAPPEDWEILLIDDFQQMQSETEGQTLCELIRSRPDRRFVILSRGAVPGYCHKDFCLFFLKKVALQKGRRV